MNQQNNQGEQQYSVDVGNELSKNMTIHKNVKQEIIFTTADKIKLVLNDTEKHVSAQRDWLASGGLLITFLTTLCTAEFKDAFGLKKEDWKAVFVVATILCVIWLVRSIWQLIANWGKGKPDYIITQIKLHSSGEQQSSNTSE